MPIRFDDPLDNPVRELAANPGHTNTAAHSDSPWIFRGAMPGKHIDPVYLRQELRPLFSSLAARLGTLTELSRQTPAAILAEALGYTAATLEKHAAFSGADYGEYVSDLLGHSAAPGVLLQSTDQTPAADPKALVHPQLTSDGDAAPHGDFHGEIGAR